MILDLDDFSPNGVYHLLTQTVIPRPIAWALTINSDEQSYNLAPFSYFNAVCSDPPLLMLSCVPKPGGNHKDTVQNILRGNSFVIHIPTENQLQAVQDSATSLPYGESELDLHHLPLTSFTTNRSGVNLQRLRDAPIAFACKLYRADSLGNAPQTLIFAEVTNIYIDEHALTQNGKHINIDTTTIAPLSRLGKNQFLCGGDVCLPS